MASGREGRAARLNERLRGAGRVNVGSDGFDLNIDGIDQPFAPASSSSPAVPKTSAGTRQSPDIPSGTDRPGEAASSPHAGRVLHSSPRRPLPFQEEITESPIHAPGSGHRRRVPVQEASASSALMNIAFESDEIQPIALPSLNRSFRHSLAPTPPTPSPAGLNADERPRDKSRDKDPDGTESMPPPRIQIPTGTPQTRAISESVSADEEAEEIGDKEAASTIGQKRPRVSPRHSPELGSEESDAEATQEVPVAKRARPAPRREPVLQRQPKKRNTAEGQPKKRGRPRKEAAAQRNPRVRVGSADDAIIEITVQRFVNGEDAGSEEEAQSEIPFANRSSETVVDVLAQVCEEVIATTLGNYQHLLENTPHDAKKKDCRIKMRAIESFREEVSAQLLQHSIYLNHWYSLRKRIRHVQKEKLELRQEILRLKAEREQVALRMDGVRGRSEKDGNDSKHRLSASHIMHDIDLAVEQGRSEGEPSSRARKEAELGNLELLISRVADQASSNGPAGGLLGHIRNFNAFLERAAGALESRGT